MSEKITVQVATVQGLLLVRGETLGADWFLDAKNKNTLDWSAPRWVWKISDLNSYLSSVAARLLD